jgi:hypothetical protein
MNMRTLIKVVGQLSVAATMVALVEPAAAFVDCPGFPRFGAVNTSFNQAGCGVTSRHRGENSNVPANRRVLAEMGSNGSGAPRRVMTFGLRAGGVPVSASCVDIDNTPPPGAESFSPPGACSAFPMTQIRMHIQVP